MLWFSANKNSNSGCIFIIPIGFICVILLISFTINMLDAVGNDAGCDNKISIWEILRRTQILSFPGYMVNFTQGTLSYGVLGKTENKSSYCNSNRISSTLQCTVLRDIQCDVQYCVMYIQCVTNLPSSKQIIQNFVRIAMTTPSSLLELFGDILWVFSLQKYFKNMTMWIVLVISKYVEPWGLQFYSKIPPDSLPHVLSS